MYLSSCPLPSIFLVIFRLIAWFDRRHNDASSRTGWPMMMQWIVEALNECTNWELVCEPKTLIMAGWMYRWGQQHGIQQWNGHHISSVFVCWRRRRRGGGWVRFIVDAHWPRPTAEGALIILVYKQWMCLDVHVTCIHSRSHVGKSKFEYGVFVCASTAGRLKCNTENYTHLRSFHPAEISTMHF